MLSSRRNRVARGGVFNLPRAQYSDETQELLKVMMEECKLSMMKRKELGRFINNGDPLPAIQSQFSKQHKSSAIELKIQPVICRRRSRDTMIEMGAYERDKIKISPQANAESEKRRLQSLMAYGTVVPQNSDRAGRSRPARPRTPAASSQRDRFEELVEEVRDRCQFLQDVGELGQAERYRAVMEAEISAKLQAMRALDPRRYEDVRKQLRLPPSRPARGKETDIKLAIR